MCLCENEQHGNNIWQLPFANANGSWPLHHRQWPTEPSREHSNTQDVPVRRMSGKEEHWQIFGKDQVNIPFDAQQLLLP